MKIVIQNFFKQHKSKILTQMFEGKDACVQLILTESQALASDHVKDIVVTGRDAKKLINQSSIWKEL